MTQADPTSTAGAARLLRDILSGNVVAATMRVVHLRTVGFLLTEAFAIAVRRRFATETDTRVITRYVADALTREGTKTGGERALRAEAVIRNALGEPWIAQELAPAQVGDVALTILCDLVETQAMTAADIERLVSAAETRRLRRQKSPLAPPAVKRRSRFVVRLLRRAETSRKPQRTVPAQSSGPRSIVGQWLRATATNDFEARDRLPEDPAEAAAGAILDAAFDLVVARRFTEGCPTYAVSTFVAGVSERLPGSRTLFSVIEALVRDRLGDSVPTAGIDSDTAYVAKILAFGCAVDDLALFDDELDELLVEAERRATAQGYDPTPALLD